MLGPQLTKAVMVSLTTIVLLFSTSLAQDSPLQGAPSRKFWKLNQRKWRNIGQLLDCLASPSVIVQERLNTNLLGSGEKLLKRQLDASGSASSVEMATFSYNFDPASLSALESQASAFSSASDYGLTSTAETTETSTAGTTTISTTFTVKISATASQDQSMSTASTIPEQVSSTLTEQTSSNAKDAASTSLSLVEISIPSSSPSEAPSSTAMIGRDNTTTTYESSSSVDTSSGFMTSSSLAQDSSSFVSQDIASQSSMSNVYFPSYVSQDTLATPTTTSNILAAVPLASIYDLYKPSVVPIFTSTSIDVYTATVAPTPVQNALPIWTPDQLGGGYGFGYYGVPQQYRVITPGDLQDRGLAHLVNPNGTADAPSNTTAKARLMLHKREMSGHEGISGLTCIWAALMLTALATILYL